MIGNALKVAGCRTVKQCVLKGQEGEGELPRGAQARPGGLPRTGSGKGQPLARETWTTLQQHQALHLRRPPMHRLTGRPRKKCVDCGRLGHWREDPARTSVQAETGKCGRQARTPRLPSMAFTALQQFGHLAMTHNLPGGTAVVDTGCTQATAGKQWLHDWAAQPETIGLKPTAKSQRQCFIGLGGFDFDDPIRVDRPC